MFRWLNGRRVWIRLAWILFDQKCVRGVVFVPKHLIKLHILVTRGFSVQLLFGRFFTLLNNYLKFSKVFDLNSWRQYKCRKNVFMSVPRIPLSFWAFFWKSSCISHVHRFKDGKRWTEGDGGLLPNEIGCTVLKRDGLVVLAWHNSPVVDQTSVQGTSLYIMILQTSS